VSQLYPRKLGLIVTASTTGLDLSEMRVRFDTVQQSGAEAPGQATIRVSNLSDATAKSIQSEFQAVELQAGYQNGPFARIFAGTLKQVKRGREMSQNGVVDSYVEMIAADGDQAYNFAVCNASLAAGSTAKQRVDALGPSLSANGVTLGDTSIFDGSDPRQLARGKAIVGLARDTLSDVCGTAGVEWFIEGGKVVFVPVAGYRAGQAPVLNSRTGLIGVPEQTAGGINLRCLLNPLIILRGTVQVDNAAINTTAILRQGLTYTDIAFATSLSSDGLYTPIQVEHHGDSRGNDWHTDIIALPVGPSSPAGQSVAAFGGP
jgi:hypothetical protein